MTDSNDTVSLPLPWRKITPLHRKNGAQVIRIPLIGLTNITANAQITVADFAYGTTTIDRVVSLYIDLAALFKVWTAATDYVVFTENITGWQKVCTQPSSYILNPQTGADQINLSMYSTKAFATNLVAPVNFLTLHLFNIELDAKIIP